MIFLKKMILFIFIYLFISTRKVSIFQNDLQKKYRQIIYKLKNLPKYNLIKSKLYLGRV